MDIINPITFNNSMVVSTSVPETDAPAWSSATSYSVGNRCIFNHRVYECLIANTNSQPDTNSTGSGAKWLDTGATNAYAMFDDKFGTQTLATNSLTVTLQLGKVIDSLAILNIAGSSVTITCKDGSNTIYTKTLTLQTDIGVSDWYTYFLAPIVVESDIVLNDILPYAFQTITITVTGTGQVGIGNILFGAYIKLGSLAAGAKVGIIDYSKKDVDTYGNTVVTPRAYSKRFSGTFMVDNSFLDRLTSILASVRSTPVVWVGSSSFSSLLVWGFYKDFEVDITYKDVSFCSITIEGLA